MTTETRTKRTLSRYKAGDKHPPLQMENKEHEWLTTMSFGDLHRISQIDSSRGRGLPDGDGVAICGLRTYFLVAPSGISKQRNPKRCSKCLDILDIIEERQVVTELRKRQKERRRQRQGE